MHCDFESNLVLMDGKFEHKLISHCYNVVCVDEVKYNQIKVYRLADENENVVKKLFDDVSDMVVYINDIRRTRVYKLPLLTIQQQIKHNITKVCEFYRVEFTEKIAKARHHNHVNGDFIATTCLECNSQVKLYNCLYLVFHYLKAYDSKFLMRGLHNHFKDKKLIS